MTFVNNIFFKTTNLWMVNSTQVKLSQETTMLYAGAELSLPASPLPLSTILAFSGTGSLYAEFSFPVRGVLVIMKEFSLAERDPPPQHSLNLFPHRYKISQRVRKMQTKLVTTMKTVNIFFSVGLRNTWSQRRHSVRLR